MSEHITSEHNRFARIPFRAICALIACALAAPAPAPAANVEARWLTPVSGDWTDPARWSTNPFYPDNGNPAETVYNAFIDVPGPEYTITLNGNVDVASIAVRSPDALLHQTGGVLNSFSLGVGDTGVGHYRMSDGTLNVNSLSVGGSATSNTGSGLFELLRGHVNSGSLSTYVGAGTGTLVVSGQFSRYVAVGPTGSSFAGIHYIGFGSLGSGLAKFQNRASVSLGRTEIGASEGTGTMLVESGANVVVDFLTVGRAASSSPGPAGDGTLILGGATSQLTVGSHSFYVGSGGHGNVIVNGGTLTVLPPAPIEGFFGVGTTGTFTVNGGAMNSQRRMFVQGGHLVINGGTVTAPWIGIGLANEGATVGATLLLTGGRLAPTELEVSSSRYVQTGGTAAPLHMSLSTSEGSPARPDARLAGGTFDAGNLTVRSGTFTYAGGTFNAIALHMTGGRFIATAGRDKTVRLAHLFMSGPSRLDLGDNVMVIDSGSPPPVASIRGLLRAGYNNGAWDGPGIMSSVAQTTPGHGIGYVQPSPLFTALLVAYTRYGDADLDGVVDLDDFNALAAHFGAGDDWFEGDFNYDGRVDLQDFNRLAAHFGQSAAGPSVTPQDWANLGAAVPEPAAVGLLALTALPLLRQRRRLQP